MTPAAPPPRGSGPSRSPSSGPRPSPVPQPGRQATPSRSLLLVEDDPAIGHGLVVSLEAEGFGVRWVEDGERALEACRRQPPDLVLLDLALPGIDGTEVCRRIRRESDVPIVMLTARDDEIDRVVGFELGADDYVTKPFSTRELVARIRAVLRRGQDLMRAEPSSAAVEAAGVRVDRARHEVRRDGAVVHLPPKEFDLLEVLVANAGIVMTRGQLLTRVWGPDQVRDTKTLEVHVRRLRRRLEADPGDPRLILTVRGVGYRFTDG
jgi:two-component system, OmpR family, response regulator RegX3